MVPNGRRLPASPCECYILITARGAPFSRRDRIAPSRTESKRFSAFLFFLITPRLPVLTRQRRDSLALRI
jgi:hypothetical protein